MKPDRLLRRITSGATSNVAFEDFRRLIDAFGFRRVRVAGSHQVFAHDRIPELPNLQPVAGEAKPYQIRRFLRLVERYDLPLESPR
jgi:hypothetical protein